MKEAQAAVDTSNERSHYSRPVFKQVLKVNSLQAQRVMERSFERVSNSLFSIEVILRIIGEQNEIDQVESIILEHISKVSEDLDKATIQLQKLMEDNGIDMMPGYTNPSEYAIEINSPQVAQFAHQIRKLDNLMGIVDTLWLNTVLTSKQRTDATYQWQQRLIKLAGRIIGIEKRARISAHTRGKESEVAEAVPETKTDDKEIADEAEKIETAA
ncbi:hypothetical protein V2H77_12055 [Photorhabdus sp. P32]|uniref:hypothetical protein n=1 Tax=Photorhabdus sp. P32 TaxID=3117549 RepID=UPI00311AC4EA